MHIVNGTPQVTPRPAAAITERWGLTRGSYVLSVGRLVPEKAPEHMLAAFADVPGDTRLVLAGGSSHTDEYVRAVRHAGEHPVAARRVGVVVGLHRPQDADLVQLPGGARQTCRAKG